MTLFSVDMISVAQAVSLRRKLTVCVTFTDYTDFIDRNGVGTQASRLPARRRRAYQMSVPGGVATGYAGISPASTPEACVPKPLTSLALLNRARRTQTQSGRFCPGRTPVHFHWPCRTKTSARLWQS